MGPIAAGDEGSGVTTTDGDITYSNVTLGGPHQYPTAETVTIAGIKSDATVTVTPNPDEVGSVFPVITEGAAAGGASGEASSDEPSGEASGEASSDEPYPLFEEYKAYLLETLLLDEFWQGNEALLRADLAAAETPDDENIQHFTGSGAVDQAPAGVVFPMTYDVWYAENAGGYAPGTYTDGVNTLVLADDMTFVMQKTGENMDGAAFVLTVTGTVDADGSVTLTGLFDGDLNLFDLATEAQIAADTATAVALLNG